MVGGQLGDIPPLGLLVEGGVQMERRFDARVVSPEPSIGFKHLPSSLAELVAEDEQEDERVGSQPELAAQVGAHLGVNRLEGRRTPALRVGNIVY